MPGRIAWGSSLPHLPLDFEQPLGQVSRGAGVAHALLLLVLVIGIGPRALPRLRRPRPDVL